MPILFPSSGLSHSTSCAMVSSWGFFPGWDYAAKGTIYKPEMPLWIICVARLRARCEGMRLWKAAGHTGFLCREARACQVLLQRDPGRLGYCMLILQHQEPDPPGQGGQRARQSRRLHVPTMHCKPGGSVPEISCEIRLLTSYHVNSAASQGWSHGERQEEPCSPLLGLQLVCSQTHAGASEAATCLPSLPSSCWGSG